MTDVVDAIKMIAIVIGPAAHTLRTLGSYFARKAGIDAMGMGGVGCGEAVGRLIPKPPRQPKNNHSIRHVPNTDRETHRSAHQPTSRSPSVLVFFASLREPSYSRRTDPEVHVTLFPARARYVPRSFGAGGVFEMTDVVDAMKMIAIVTGTAAHTLRCYR